MTERHRTRFADALDEMLVYAGAGAVVVAVMVLAMVFFVLWIAS